MVKSKNDSGETYRKGVLTGLILAKRIRKKKLKGGKSISWKDALLYAMGPWGWLGNAIRKHKKSDALKEEYAPQIQKKKDDRAREQHKNAKYLEKENKISQTDESLLKDFDEELNDELEYYM